ncbi:ABC transporter substrate-binding protein [bacterium]|nr:ABC transporter substrate-binding protein [bacterium]
MYHTSHIIKAEGWIEKVLHTTPEWKLFPTGPAMVEAFAAGSIDIGYIGLPPAMIGIEKGIAIKCVAGGHVEGTVIIASDNFQSFDVLHDIDQVLKQFKDKILGTPTRGSIHDVIIRNLIDERGENTEVKNFSWADLIPEAIDNEEIAGAVGTPPLAVISAQECAAKIVIPPHKLWPYNPSYGIVVRKELFSNKNLLADFLTLHERACNLIREKPEEAASIISDAVKVVDSSFVIKVFQISPKYCASLPKPYIDSTMAFVAVLNQLGYIEKALAEEEVFDLATIQKIHPQSDHYSNPGNLI